MLLLVSQYLGKTRAISEASRELSLIKKPFHGSDGLAEALKAKSRRIVCLGDDDITGDTIVALSTAGDGEPFGLIVCADREALRSCNKADLIDQLNDFGNVEWVGDAEDLNAFRQAIRICWQRMLRISQAELRQAIDNREFVIQYQPKVERVDGDEWETREAESLLRWRHPEHGLLGPLEFLPEAEAFGLMGAITELVLEEAAIQLNRWHKGGLEFNSCINLAPSMLRDRELPTRYEEIVREHGHEPSRFTFEVTESDVGNADAPHLKVLQRFRDKGFRISLDDFGVAASSLQAFEQLPFDEIKIHRSALQRAKASPVAQQVLAAVTGLAHSLKISVCAEGVEDQETYEFLKTIQCDKMQGFLISEAVMPDIIRKYYSASDEVEAA